MEKDQEMTEEMETEASSEVEPVVVKATADENMQTTSATFDKLNQIRNQRTGLARKYYNDLRCKH